MRSGDFGPASISCSRRGMSILFEPQARLRENTMILLRNVLAALLLAFVAAGAQAQAQLGRDYILLDPPRAVSSGDKIEVIEFFYYGCAVCYELEP